MKGSSKLKAMDEHTGGVNGQTNERKQRMNKRTTLRMNEQTRQSNERNASQTNGKWTNGTNKRRQTRQPNRWLKYNYSSFETRKTVPVWLRI